MRAGERMSLGKSPKARPHRAYEQSKALNLNPRQWGAREVGSGKGVDGAE